MYRKDFETDEAPAISGHSFAVDGEACTQCHADPDALVADLQAEIQADLDDIYARLGDPAEWEYINGDEPGPQTEEEQNALSDEIKQVRFLYHYVLSDGSLGPHNPAFIRSMMAKADELLVSIGR
jgi:formate-dependent nitrite reductase cytochrome c552 subunit